MKKFINFINKLNEEWLPYEPYIVSNGSIGEIHHTPLGYILLIINRKEKSIDEDLYNILESFLKPELPEIKYFQELRASVKKCWKYFLNKTSDEIKIIGISFGKKDKFDVVDSEKCFNTVNNLRKIDKYLYPKDGKVKFIDIDPYGEENWEDDEYKDALSTIYRYMGADINYGYIFKEPIIITKEQIDKIDPDLKQNWGNRYKWLNKEVKKL